MMEQHTKLRNGANCTVVTLSLTAVNTANSGKRLKITGEITGSWERNIKINSEIYKTGNEFELMI